MKKRLTFITTCLMAFTCFTGSAKAAAYPVNTQTAIEYQDDSFLIESSLTVFEPLVQPFSDAKTKTAQKTYTAKYAGHSIATYTLTAEFSYNQTTATCINTGYSSSILDSAWSFTSKTANKSGNKAYGSFTVKSSSGSKSDTVTITCSPSGVIS